MKLCYDPDLGSYYQYDDQLKTYTLHSRVDFPECQMRKRQPEREVEIILIDEDELSGQFLMFFFFSGREKNFVRSVQKFLRFTSYISH